MTRNIGTVARGVRCPIIRQGDDLSEMVVNSVIEAAKTDGFELGDRDVIGITESIVARSQETMLLYQLLVRMLKTN